MRPVADIRFGILTIREKWELMLGCKTSSLTEGYLAKKFPLVKEKDNLIINGAICPNKALLKEISQMEPGHALIKGDTILAMYLNELDFKAQSDAVQEINTEIDCLQIVNTWDIFVKNAEAIKQDYNLITKNRKSAPLPAHCIAIAPENIFIEEGAQVLASTLNATEGPIYIGKDAIIMEGCNLRGPLAICNNATVKMGAKIYGGTTIGPFSKIGGEVSNSVIFGYSNKAHDGFMGNSVIAEWCNIGADTNTSNLKNTYDSVKLWSYTDETFVDTNQQFCGLIMGDHTKCGINTMFNTGTVVGVSSNVFGSGFQRNFIPSFRWGGVSGFQTFQPSKAATIAREVYKRRNLEFTEIDEQLLQDVFNRTHEYRKI